MKIEDMITVLEAAKDGAKIQTKRISPYMLHDWADMTEAQGFDFTFWDYRVKPWILHDGESFPDCSPHDLVDIQRKDNQIIYSTIAGFTVWNSNGGDYDVIAWRLAE